MFWRSIFDETAPPSPHEQILTPCGFGPYRESLKTGAMDTYNGHVVSTAVIPILPTVGIQIYDDEDSDEFEVPPSTKNFRAGGNLELARHGIRLGRVSPQTVATAHYRAHGGVPPDGRPPSAQLGDAKFCVGCASPWTSGHDAEESQVNYLSEYAAPYDDRVGVGVLGVVQARIHPQVPCLDLDNMQGKNVQKPWRCSKGNAEHNARLVAAQAEEGAGQHVPAKPFKEEGPCVEGGSASGVDTAKRKKCRNCEGNMLCESDEDGAEVSQERVF